MDSQPVDRVQSFTLMALGCAQKPKRKGPTKIDSAILCYFAPSSLLKQASNNAQHTISTRPILRPRTSFYKLSWRESS